MLIYDNISTGGILWRLESTEIRFRPDFCPEPRWENSPPLGELTMIRRPPSPLRGENSLPIPNPSTPLASRTSAPSNSFSHPNPRPAAVPSGSAPVATLAPTTTCIPRTHWQSLLMTERVELYSKPGSCCEKLSKTPYITDENNTQAQQYF